jgi:hypothetical protein
MTALDELTTRYQAVNEYVNGCRPFYVCLTDEEVEALTAAAKNEQAQLLSLIQTLALALARSQGVPLDECEGGLLGEARAVLGRYPKSAS